MRISSIQIRVIIPQNKINDNFIVCIHDHDWPQPSENADFPGYIF